MTRERSRPTSSTPLGRSSGSGQGVDLAGFRTDDLVRSGVERKLEIVGEALNRLSRDHPELASQIPDIGRFIGFRNVLAHGYDVVDDEVVWDAVTTDLPELTASVEALLAELEREQRNEAPANDVK